MTTKLPLMHAATLRKLALQVRVPSAGSAQAASPASSPSHAPALAPQPLPGLASGATLAQALSTTPAIHGPIGSRQAALAPAPEPAPLTAPVVAKAAALAPTPMPAPLSPPRLPAPAAAPGRRAPSSSLLQSLAPAPPLAATAAVAQEGAPYTAQGAASDPQAVQAPALLPEQAGAPAPYGAGSASLGPGQVNCLTPDKQMGCQCSCHPFQSKEILELHACSAQLAAFHSCNTAISAESMA